MHRATKLRPAQGARRQARRRQPLGLPRRGACGRVSAVASLPLSEKATATTDVDGQAVSLQKRPPTATTTAGVPSDLDWLDADCVTAYEEMAGAGETAQVHPYQFTTALAALAEQHGVRIVRGTASGISFTADGSVQGVSYIPRPTAAAEQPGEPETQFLPAAKVVLAAGPVDGERVCAGTDYVDQGAQRSHQAGGVRLHALHGDYAAGLVIDIRDEETRQEAIGRGNRHAGDLRATRRHRVRVRHGRQSGAAAALGGSGAGGRGAVPGRARPGRGHFRRACGGRGRGEAGVLSAECAGAKRGPADWGDEAQGADSGDGAYVLGDPEFGGDGEGCQ